MFKIKTLNEISRAGLCKLQEYSVGGLIDNPDAIILRSYKILEEDLNSNLLAIARSGVGVNNIPIDICTNKGIVVFNTPGANSNAVKEATIAGILLAARKISEGIEWLKTVQAESCEELKTIVEKGKKDFSGGEIRGKTVAVIGLGAIGRLVADSLHLLGMHVRGYDPFFVPNAVENTCLEVFDKLQDAVSSADYITFHIPLIPETSSLICKEFLTGTKTGVAIINFSRGELVNEVDLKEALEHKLVSRYVTDFVSPTLLNLENVVTIPHLGASTYESEENSASISANCLKDFLINGNIRNSVNFPMCDFGMLAKNKVRITVINKNVPNMIAKIVEIFSDLNINIDRMLNSSLNDMAYTMLDLDKIFLNEKSKEQIESSLQLVEGIVRVRIIS